MVLISMETNVLAVISLFLILSAKQLSAKIDCNIIVKSSKGIYRGCNQSVPTVSILEEPDQFKVIYSFKGIPYAVPPTGDLRFRKPVPIVYNVMTEVDASSFRSACKQLPLASKKSIDYLNSSEDCLHLNIFTPSLSRDAYLPVMVYINGGGFLFDSSRSVTGELLSLRDVVVVTFNYRLGVFGFLCTDREDAPGNVGLWDQALALNWTKHNIKNFGGNPIDITIFGQSAGAVSVSSHIVSNVTRDYFKSAILQSGSSLTNVWLRSKDYSTRVAQRFAKFVSCDKKLDYVDCLRKKSADNLMAAQTMAFLWNTNNADAKPWYSAVMFEFVQCYGDQFLPKHVFQLLDSGNFNKDLAVMTGHTTMESAQFTFIYDLIKSRFGSNTAQAPDAVVNLQIAKSDIKSLMINNNSFDDIIVQEYTKTFDNTLNLTPNAYHERQRLRAAVGHSFSDYLFVCPTVLFGKYLVRNKKFTGNVFQYYLGYANSHSICKISTWCKNTHLDDVPLVFGQPYYLKGYSETDRKMSSVLMDIFTSFAKTKEAPDVNRSSWPAYSVERYSGQVYANYMVLDSQNLGKTYINRYIGNNGFEPKVIQNCKFWEPILRSLF